MRARRRDRAWSSRRYARLVTAAALATGAGLTLAACGGGSPSTVAQTTTPNTGTATAPAAPQTAPGAPPGGAPSSTPQYTATGKLTVSGGSIEKANATISATADNQSGVLVTDSGSVTLKNTKVQTSGNSKSSDESSFYGLNAGVLAKSNGKATISGGSVVTSGDGANDVFAYGSGSSVVVSNATLKATGQYAHGAMTSGGGSLSLTDVRISTSGASSAAVATDRGGGTVTVKGGAMTTSGDRSPGIYSTGKIDVSGATMTATGAEAAVIEGGNSITVTDTTLDAAKSWGALIYSSMSGDAAAGTGTYSMSGGSLTAAEGAAFRVTNAKAVITVEGGAAVNAKSGILLQADSTGTGSGNTGAGVADFTAIGETLTGNLATSGKGSIAATLKNGTTLTGAIKKAALTLDSSSKWVVTRDSELTSLDDPSGISGSTITNIVGNGHDVYYDSSLMANSKLGGKTYSLAGGGHLIPQ